MIRLPRAGTRPRQVLQILLTGPATFYQICERMQIDLERPGAEPAMRAIIGDLAAARIRLDGIVYSLSPATRAALQEEKTVPSCCSVAGPHYRGPGVAQPVRVISRSIPAEGGCV